MKFNPASLGYRVILRPLDVKKMSDGGIDLSAMSDRVQAINSDKGEVLMIGESAWDDLSVKPDIKVGDKVFYAKWGAKTLQDPNNKDMFYILCNDEDILVSYDTEETTNA